MSQIQAIVFDLDDTLYPYRSFVASGFKAVSKAVEREFGIACTAAFKALCRARTHGDRGKELQRLCEQYGLPKRILPELIELMREHTPSIQLSSQAACVLQHLQRDWLVGIVTNGNPRIQSRKVAALGVWEFADAIVFAEDTGAGRGKPRREPFERILEHLSVQPQAAVHVGDDPVADVGGASRVGMKTIHFRGHAGHPTQLAPFRCDAVASTLLHVPALAAHLLHPEERQHVA